MDQQHHHLLTGKIEARHAFFETARSNERGEFRVGVPRYKREDGGRAVGPIAVTPMADCATVRKRPRGDARLLTQKSVRHQKKQSDDPTSHERYAPSPPAMFHSLLRKGLRTRITRASPGSQRRNGDVGDGSGATVTHDKLQLSLQDIEDTFDTGVLEGAQSPQHGAADTHRFGAEREGLEYVVSAANNAIELLIAVYVIADLPRCVLCPCYLAPFADQFANKP